MAESVKVAVRVRPFNSRERDRAAKCVLDMIGALTQITDPENPGNPPKEFTFDFSYWSHDGFHEDENGYLVADSDKYATQRKVFDDLGQGVLNNAFAGFNCSLFAYGQTGAGKSYSMVGYGNNKGIVPITCDELFQAMEKGAEGVKYQVSFSMLEIYNEQVRDLLVKSNPKGGLQVRQNPKEGNFFVQNLKRVAVVDYADIERRIEEGTANRTVAATQMNATSSRAHTVVTIIFDQISKNESGQETKKSSNINLVDLAGSERADSTGATGDRLKEGANINKSLSALGNVISALADLSMGKKKVLVPYRDSVLTKLLQNALGGNSKTIMIAALSPADINYDETLSTLRYADRAKKIKNKAVVNENPMDKLIRELREENEKLKKMFEGGGLPDLGAGAGGMSEAEKEEMRKQMKDELLAQMEFNAQSMMSWDEKVQMSQSDSSAGEQSEKQKKVQNVPHLINLNEDPMLSRVIFHFLEQVETRIGRKDADPVPNIPLTGLSILKHHALVKTANNEITIEPGSPGAKIKVNGMPLTGERVLKHNDRILFGSNHMYFLVNPTNKEKSEGTPDSVDWEFAQKEIAQAKGFATGFGSGLSKDQQRAQEQVLELLPIVSEVNAISEELNKHKTFEVILISGAAQGGDSETKVMVRMKNLLNGNVWLWDRGKFMNRRFLMQEHYQRSSDGEDMSKIPKEEDPFWEPPEDVLIGTASVFLQSLSYALDFDDKLSITDYKGEEVATTVINVSPCNPNGKPLNEEFFVEDPSELLGKPYHFKVSIRNANVHDSRFNKGLYIRYKPFKETEFTVTTTVRDTLSPEFDEKDSKVFGFDSVKQELLDWFDSGCITFQLMGRQEDSDPDVTRKRMTTKELRQMEMQMVRPGMGGRSTTMVGHDIAPAQLKAEHILLKRKNQLLLKKEKRIQDLCQEWANKPKEEQTFEGFHRAVSAAAAHQYGRTKYKVNTLMVMLKNQNGTTANGGVIKQDPKVTEGSRACAIM